MRLQLNTKDKTLTFEKSITYRLITKAIRLIVDNTEVFEEYKIEIGKVPIDNLIQVQTPASNVWDLKRNYEWLEYKGNANIMIEDNNLKTDDKRYAILKEGIYNIEIT